MKRTIKFILGFALLGALVGACLPFLLDGRDLATHVLPLGLHVSDFAAVLLQTVISGLFIGSTTGLAVAFSSGRFPVVRCLLAIQVPAILVTYCLAPTPYKGEGEDTRLLMGYVVYAVAAIAMAVLLACLGHRRMKRSLPPAPPPSPAR